VLGCWAASVDGSIVRVEEAADSCGGCCDGWCGRICCLSNDDDGGSMIEAADSMRMWSMSTRPMRSARTWTARIESLIGGRTTLSTRSLGLMAVSIGSCSFVLSCIRLTCRRDVCASLAPLLRGGLLVCYCCYCCCYCCCHSTIRYDFIVLCLCLFKRLKI
jgi:hypothetical protein